MEFIYVITIKPLEQLIIYVLGSSIELFGNIPLSLLALSLVINFLLIPFYILSDKFQRKESEVQNRMAPKIKEFNSIFSGYEKHLMMSELYKKNGYKSYYFLRGIFPLLIQIPFFIATYYALSNTDYRGGANSTIDFTRPDGLIFGENLFPILMFVLNCGSVFFYSSIMTVRQTINSFGIALIFLVILYNSPAGLVIYWVFNNLIGLIKNIVVYKGHSLLFHTKSATR